MCTCRCPVHVPPLFLCRRLALMLSRKNTSTHGHARVHPAHHAHSTLSPTPPYMHACCTVPPWPPWSRCLTPNMPIPTLLLRAVSPRSFTASHPHLHAAWPIAPTNRQKPLHFSYLLPPARGSYPPALSYTPHTCAAHPAHPCRTPSPHLHVGWEPRIRSPPLLRVGVGPRGVVVGPTQAVPGKAGKGRRGTNGHGHARRTMT